MANVWRNPVGVCPHAVESGPPAEPAQSVLDRDRGKRPPVAGEEDVIDVAPDRPRPAVGKIVRQPGLGHGALGDKIGSSSRLKAEVFRFAPRVLPSCRGGTCTRP